MKIATHMIFAEACWLGACGLFDIEYGTGAVVSAAAFSILPDADYPKSWLGHQLGGVSEWLNRLFGHRSFLHSLLALTALGLMLYVLREHTSGTWWLAAIVGYASHLFADMMTVGGIRLFWPSRVICGLPGRDEYRVISGGSSERIFVAISLAAALLLYPVRQQGLEHLLYGLRQGEELYGYVDRVIDGDTLEMDLAGKTKEVRLIGVDTPETVDPNRPLQCYGQEASDFTRWYLEGQVVRLALLSLGDSTDAYGRTLAYVYADILGGSEEELFNLELLRGGYAKTTNFDHEFRREFKKVETEAAKRGVGLWGACPEEEPESGLRY